MIKSLRYAGISVKECHETLWRGESDRVNAASGGWIKPGFIWRVILVYARLFRKAFGIKDYQAILIGYPGQVDVFFGRLIAWLAHKPLIWDIYMSTYQLARERGLGNKSPLTLSLLHWLEKMALKLPDQLILDTPAHIQWFGRTYNIPASRFWLIPAGADDSVFQPPKKQRQPDGVLRVVYYGTFIPNHGVPYIIETAKLLANQPMIQFELVGDGPQREACMAQAQAADLQNITFTRWMEKTELAEHVCQADIILGAFGQTEMSKMTVQNKIYEGMAMARPVITGESPAVRQMLQPGKHLLTCDREHPESLASAILSLMEDEELRKSLGEKGHAIYVENFSIPTQGKRWAGFLRSLIPDHPSTATPPAGSSG